MGLQDVGARAVIEGLSGFNAGMDQMDARIAKVGSTAAKSGASMKIAFAAVGVGVAAVAAGFGGAITAAASFEKTMSGIGAVAGATAGEMKQLSALALQLGKDTSFSASEAAQGIEELVKGGVSIADIMGGGAKASLDLAAAGAVGLADAAEIAANAMSMFQLKGSDLPMVADQIAGAANASSLSVMDFKFSLAAVGAVANLAGQDFKSTATAIALMGAAGIKGQDAGTSLKTMLMNLIPTTKTQSNAMRELGILTADGSNKFVDAAGNFKSLRDISEILNQSLKGLSESQRTVKLEAIFGSDAIRAGAVLARGGADAYDKMAESMGKVTAASVAAERLNNVKGSLEQLKGSLETAAITMGMAFLPGLKRVIDGMTDGVNKAIPFAGAIEDIAAALAKGEGFDVLYDGLIKTFGEDVASKIAGVVDPIARFRVEVLPGLIAAVKPAADVLTHLASVAFQGVIDSARLVSDGVRAMGSAFGAATEFVRDHESAQLAVAVALSGTAGVLGAAGIMGAIAKVGAAFAALSVAVTPTLLLLSNIGFIWTEVTATLSGGGLVALLGTTTAAFVGLAGILGGILVPLTALAFNIGGIRETLTSLQDNLKTIFSKLPGFIGDRLGEIGKSIDTASATVGQFFSDLGTAVNSGLTAASAAVGGFFSGLGTTVNAGLTAAWAFITERFSAIPGIFQAGWDAAAAAGMAFWSGLTGVVQAGIDAITAPVRGFQQILDAFEGDWASALGFVTGHVARFVGDTLRAIVNWGVGAHDALATWAQQSIAAAANFAAGAVGAIGDFASAALSSVQGWASSAAGAIAGFATAAPAVIASFASAALATIGSWVAGAGLALQGWASNAVAAIGQFASAAPDAIARFASAALATIGGWVAGAGVALQGWASSALATLGEWATNGHDAIVLFVTNAITTIQNFIPVVVNNFKTMVTDSVAALRGLSDQVPQVFGSILDYLLTLPGQWRDAAVAAARSFWEGFKQGLGIHSPSYVERAFMAISAAAVSTADTVSTAVAGMVQSLTSMGGFGLQSVGLAPSDAAAAGAWVRSHAAAPAATAGGEESPAAKAAADALKAQLEAAGKLVEKIMSQIGAGAKADLGAALALVAQGEWVEDLKKRLAEAIRVGADITPITGALALVAAVDKAREETAKAQDDRAKAVSDLVVKRLKEAGRVTALDWSTALAEVARGEWLADLEKRLQETIRKEGDPSEIIAALTAAYDSDQIRKAETAFYAKEREMAEADKTARLQDHKDIVSSFTAMLQAQSEASQAAWKKMNDDAIAEAQRLTTTFLSLTPAGQAAVAAAGGIGNVLGAPMHYENGMLVPGMAHFGPGMERGYAHGTMGVPGVLGMRQTAWVGERGPELVSLPVGSAVTPMNRSTTLNFSANYTQAEPEARLRYDAEYILMQAGL